MGLIKYILVFLIIFSYALYAKGLKEITVQLEWKNSFEFSGFFVAQEKGYYKNIGLNVKTKEWNNDIDTAKDVMDEKVTYGLVRPSSLINISKGDNLVYLLAIYQSNPLIILADKKSGIKSIEDLKHKRIMATKDHLREASIVSMLSSQSVNVNDLDIVEHSFDVKDIMNGKADAMFAYISNEPFLLKERGGEPVIFNSKDYGFDFYNDILIAKRDYLHKYPQEVKKFRDATIKGYKYAFNHIEEVVDMIYRKYNTLHKTKEALLYEAKELKKLAYYKTDKIGTILDKKLDKIYNTYKLLGFIKDNINVNQIIYERIYEDNSFTPEEKKYLQNKNSISLCVDPNAMPFDHIDTNGKYTGISADYIRLLEKALSIKIIPQKTSSWYESQKLAKEQKCDIMSSAIKTPSRETYLNFTNPYLKYPLVAATKMDVPFVNGMKDLRGKKIGIIKGYAFTEIAKNNYPSIKVVEVENIKDGLELVDSGELFAFVDTLPSIVYSMQLNQSENLKISGKVYNDWDLRFGVRKDDLVLLNILKKAISNITTKQKQDILNRWISVTYENGIDYDLIKKIGFFSIVVLILILSWNRKIASNNELLQKAYEEIESKNKELSVLATTDKLTGIYNRLKLDNILEYELNRSQRYKSEFGVAILDIDFFKKVNDTFGHQVGDIVLKEVSDIIIKSIRNTDCVGRWGGEEFLIICLEINEKNLFLLMERIKKQIKEYHFANKTHITASIGITLNNERDSVQALIKRADEALYEAKNRGRDRIIINYATENAN